jgi:hypothetical protein
MTADRDLEQSNVDRDRLLERLMAIARIVSVSDLPLGDKREILALCTGGGLLGHKASEQFIEPVTAARFKRLMDAVSRWRICCTRCNAPWAYENLWSCRECGSVYCYRCRADAAGAPSRCVCGGEIVSEGVF